MGDMGDFFNDLKEHNKARRHKNLEEAQKSEIDWTKHTPWHWSITLQDDRLDYWPTKNKFRWRNRTYHGTVDAFIRKRQGV